MTKVLIIDDSKAIQKLVASQVVAAGGQIVGSAYDGDEGIELFERLKPDLILLDITMPNKDGRECLKEIMTINPNAAVIMLSAVDTPEVIQECIKLGAQAFINKTTGIHDGSLKAALLKLLTPTPASA